MMPVIRARNAIEEINLMALAFGSMDEKSAGSFTTELQQQATIAAAKGAPVRQAVRPSSPEELKLLMGDSGQALVMGR